MPRRTVRRLPWRPAMPAGATGAMRCWPFSGWKAFARSCLLSPNSESVAGSVTARAARETGLAAGTPVAIGAGDVPATIVGASALETGAALVVLGTTCIVGVVADRPVFEPADLGLLFTLPGNCWFRSMVNVAGTLNLDWAVATILGAASPDGAFYARLEEMVSAVPVGSGRRHLPALSQRQRHHRTGGRPAGACRLPWTDAAPWPRGDDARRL